MEAQDLRIGNLVKHNDGYQSNVVGLSLRNDGNVITSPISKFCGGTGRFEDQMSPIPLTPEWLERLGFKWHNGYECYLIKIKSKMYLSVERTKNGRWLSQIGWKMEWTNTISIKYVHQLQNLYYSLTGTELKAEI